jgi:hypothetical protein
MTCLAGNPGMGIVGHFFIMGKVALPAIPGHLIMVVKGGGFRMTDRAGHSGVRSLIIFFHIYQRDTLFRHLLGLGPLTGMAVETEPGNHSFIFWTFRFSLEVAGYAAKVLRLILRQVCSKLMTGSALFMTGPVRIEFAGPPISRLHLIMRVMAADTMAVRIRIPDFFCTVKTLFNIVHDIVVTRKAFLNDKKVSQFLVDV